MSAEALIFESPARKQLLKLPLQTHERIIKALIIIKENPIIGAKLHGELQNYYKYRIGDYRIIYSFDSKNSIVKVVKIEHRQGVYK